MANGLHELLGNYKTEAKLLKLKKSLSCVYRRRHTKKHTIKIEVSPNALSLYKHFAHYTSFNENGSYMKKCIKLCICFIKDHSTPPECVAINL